MTAPRTSESPYRQPADRRRCSERVQRQIPDLTRTDRTAVEEVEGKVGGKDLAESFAPLRVGMTMLEEIPELRALKG